MDLSQCSIEAEPSHTILNAAIGHPNHDKSVNVGFLSLRVPIGRQWPTRPGWNQPLSSWPGLSRPSVAAPCLDRWPGQARPWRWKWGRKRPGFLS